MKRFLPILVLASLFTDMTLYQDHAYSTPSFAQAESALQRAFASKQSDIQIKGSGRVIKLLRDDQDGARHQ